MNTFRKKLLLVPLIVYFISGPCHGFPTFRNFAEKNSGRQVNCAMCHVNSQGPSGDGIGQLGSLNADEMMRVDNARQAMEPGVDVDSPIMNKFGNHIIKTIGMKKVFEAVQDPQILAKALGDKSDLDGDGISDAQEFLDGTDPLDKFNGDPRLLLLTNLKRHLGEILFVAMAIGLLLFGLSNFIRGVKEKSGE